MANSTPAIDSARAAASVPALSWQRDAAAVADAMFATSSVAPPPASRVAWLIDDLTHFLDTVGGQSKLAFHAALKAVVLTSPALVFKLRPFHMLPLDARIQALERFENGPLGIAMFAVKTLLCFIWYEHPDSAIEAGLVKNVRALARPRVRGAR